MLQFTSKNPSSPPHLLDIQRAPSPRSSSPISHSWKKSQLNEESSFSVNSVAGATASQFSGKYSSVTPSKHCIEDVLLDAYNYIHSVKGKGIRKLMIQSFVQQWFPDFRKDYLLIINDVIRMLHTSSLMIDDIQDNSKLRRGVPCAHRIYGVPQTINTANYVYFLALDLVASKLPPQATKVFVTQMLSLHHGQGSELFWRENVICPTVLEYEQMVKEKTGGLFRLGIDLIQACTGKPKTINLDNLVELLSVYFQILDDYINIASVDYMKNKSFCEDLTEGKFSFPIIHSIRSRPDNHRLISVLRQRTEDVELKQYAVDLMKETNSLFYTEQVLHYYFSEIEKELNKLGGNKPLLELFAKMHSAVPSHGSMNVSVPSVSDVSDVSSDSGVSKSSEIPKVTTPAIHQPDPTKSGTE